MPDNLRVLNQPAPGGSISQRPIYQTEEYRNRLGRNLDLSDSVLNKLKKRIKREIEAYEDDTKELQRLLEEANNQVEGIVEDTDFPWEGCSNVHIPLTGIYMQIFHSVERRSILGSDLIWYAETLDEELREITPEIDIAMNYLARSEWNIAEALSEVFWTTNRDGLGVMKVPYVEEYEYTEDVVLVASEDEFLDEFPSPEESGLDPEEWEDWLIKSGTEADEQNPLEIPVGYDKMIYRGPKGEVVELADFLIFPSTAKSLKPDVCRGYGMSYSLRRGAVKKRKSEGLWYAASCERFLKKTRKSSDANSYTRSKDRIEGLVRGEKSEDYRFHEIVYRYELKEGEGERKLLITYSKDADEIMSVIAYPYRVDFYALFRIEKRPNRLIGPSLPYKLRDAQEEMNTQHNQRINSRTISTVPIMKGKQKAGYLKDFMDSEEGRIRPGLVYWLEDMADLEQFTIANTDLGESMAEEKNGMNICDLYLGASAALLSGHTPPGDPSAPGNKTSTLIGQSNLRMDDPLQELREGVETVGEICVSHMYQFGPTFIQYAKDAGNGKSETMLLPKRILRKGIKMKMQGITVALNPDSEFARSMMEREQFLTEPLIAQSPQRRIELLRRAMSRGRILNRDKILPSYEEIMQEEVNLRKQAIMQIEAEKQQAAMQQDQERKKAIIDQARQALQTKQLASKITKEGMGMKRAA